jgi:hypothetical protein
LQLDFRRDCSAMRDPTRPSVMLRLDGLAVALVAILLYRELGVAWWVFAAGFLAPDLAIAAYLAGPRIGAVAYNTVHTYLWGALLFGLGLFESHAWLMAIGLIWTAHVAVDRLVGFGLKYPDGFRRTHLQRV